ncbi:hypothetical protein L596_029108 [Steinernema carpocapsae]|uniref:Uncharacterized protein n=1 Tax=Steinernema carpocapsae TaxID=34508 RepID=A0A4U5LTN6_STECR|nr:hypothetical protein L596_029108 [Steinernema carpocapsae]
MGKRRVIEGERVVNGEGYELVRLNKFPFFELFEAPLNPLPPIQARSSFFATFGKLSTSGVVVARTRDARKPVAASRRRPYDKMRAWRPIIRPCAEAKSGALFFCRQATLVTSNGVKVQVASSLALLTTARADRERGEITKRSAWKFLETTAETLGLRAENVVEEWPGKQIKKRSTKSLRIRAGLRRHTRSDFGTLGKMPAKRFLGASGTVCLVQKVKHQSIG